MNTRVSLLFVSLLFVSFSRGMYSQKTVFAVMPDTQTYLESCPEVLEKQIDWIVTHKSNIDAVIQLGDLTQDNHPLEWYTMSKFFKKFEQDKINYTFSLGNHDMGSVPRKCADVRNTNLANKYFPKSRMEKQKCWGDSYGNKIDNHFIVLDSGGVNWLIISLEFGASDKVLAWADSVLCNNSDKIAIINTHAYMYSDSTRMGNNANWIPQNYGISKDSNDTVNNGEQIWDKLVSKHSNIIAVLSGHVLNTGVGTLVSEGKAGNSVYQMLSNYQRGVDNSEKVKEGYIRLLTFDHKKKVLKVETISTVTGDKHPSSQHNFIFKNIEFNSYIKNSYEEKHLNRDYLIISLCALRAKR